jgi:hypothetical protein
VTSGVRDFLSIDDLSPEELAALEAPYVPHPVSGI